MSRRKKKRKLRESQEQAAQKHLRAVLRYLRASPRKVKPLADMIRGLKVDAALALLEHTPRAAAKPMAAMLRSAVSNAANRQDIDIDRLVVKDVQVSPGPILKRWMPRALGRATRINRRTCHISFRLEAGKK